MTQSIETNGDEKLKATKPQAAKPLSDTAEAIRVWSELLARVRANGNVASHPPQISDAQIKFEQQRTALAAEVAQLTGQLKSLASDKATFERRAAELQTKLEQQQKNDQLRHLLNRLNLQAQEKLLSDEAFKIKFVGQTDAFVVSIDMRRSTDLMLKARTGAAFADFMVGLADALRRVIVDNFGVFDKFTGDGILAFFPTFYSGDDAALRVVKAAEECHTAFRDHFEEHVSAFDTVIEDAGLGIGIDFGVVELVQIGGDLTVVGKPVVYACRLGGAPAGRTFVNQRAFEALMDKYSAFLHLEQDRHELKNEGIVRVHSVRRNGKTLPELAPPAWLAPAPVEVAGGDTPRK